MNLGVRHITLSTVGIAANIPNLLSLERLPNLAVSLHAATDELREQIVPMNKGFPLKNFLPPLMNTPIKLVVAFFMNGLFSVE